MCGEPRVAAECTCTERESGRCSRPTVRPGRNVNDEHDHGDGSSTRPRGRCSWPPSPAIAVPASLASCRCRCRRPRTVCVVPRERWGVPGGVSRERTRPWTGDRCRPPGLPPSDGDAVVAGLAAGAKRVIGQGHGDDRIGRMAVPEQIIDPAVLVLAIEGVEPRQLEFVALQGRDVADEQVPALAGPSSESR